MKRLILISTMMLIGIILSAQTSVSVLYSPQDAGKGLRIDQQETTYGIYGSVAYGNYKSIYGYAKDHYRMAVGATKHSEQSYVGIGVAYCRFGDTDLPAASKALIPVTIELCGGVKIGRLICGLAVDVVKFSAGVNFGFNFGNKE